MARVFKPTYTKTDPATGAKTTRQLSKWYVEYRDADGRPHKVPGYTDKKATEQLAARLERDAARQQEGLVDPYAEHRKRPLAEHLADYKKDLESQDNSPVYVSMAVSRLESLFEGCGFKVSRDLSDGRVLEWLADLRKQGRPRTPLAPGKETYTLAEACAVLQMRPRTLKSFVLSNRLESAGRGKRRTFPRATVEAVQDRFARGVSVETSNAYLKHAKAFCNWMVKRRRMPENPLAHLARGNALVDRRHDRRELEAEELRRLLDVTRASGRSYRGLTGADRFALYATACGTGFRASGLASLTPESFDLDADPPTVTLAARRNKSRVLKVQPLPADVAKVLREHLGGKPAGRPIWPGTWASSRKGGEMLRLDLEAGGIPYSVEGPDGPLFADFHALRHTYLTLGGRAGIDLRTLQELAGHSTPTLTARYSHRRLHDLAGAVEKLPSFLPGRDDGAEALRATGTAGGAGGQIPTAPVRHGGRHVVQHVGPAGAGPHSEAPAGTSADVLPLTEGGHKSGSDGTSSTPGHSEAPGGTEGGEDGPTGAGRLTRLALSYLQKCQLLDQSARFDVLAVSWPRGRRQPRIVHHVAAFEAVGRFQMFS
jgi:integrase